MRWHQTFLSDPIVCPCITASELEFLGHEITLEFYTDFHVRVYFDCARPPSQYTQGG